MKRIIAIMLMVLVLVFGTSAAAFGAEADPYITIVNPAADTPVASTSLLISVKIAKAETIRVTVFKENVTTQKVTAADGTISDTKVTTWNAVFTSDNFKSTSNLSFYTKKLENVAVGNYIVRVDTIGSGGKVIYQTARGVSVTGSKDSGNVFQSSGGSGVSTFIQSLLKSIFGN